MEGWPLVVALAGLPFEPPDEADVWLPLAVGELFELVDVMELWMLMPLAPEPLTSVAEVEPAPKSVLVAREDAEAVWLAEPDEREEPVPDELEPSPEVVPSGQMLVELFGS
jgi:hypothetical protein